MRDLNILMSAPPPKAPYVVSLEMDEDSFKENMKED